MCTEHDHALHEITGLEERLTEIIEAMRDMEARLRAEMIITEITTARGFRNVPWIVDALRQRAGVLIEPRSAALTDAGTDADIRSRTARELLAAATRIEQEAKIT